MQHQPLAVKERNRRTSTDLQPMSDALDQPGAHSGWTAGTCLRAALNAPIFACTEVKRVLLTWGCWAPKRRWRGLQLGLYGVQRVHSQP